MANYLPVLLVSVSTNAIPDDSSLTTMPQGQVDYLSHDWQEEDVWRSWRSVARQRNEIANGVRLENASWRTWWKQRNKLKTVSPEALNWLKDSDVTWLYGPLHTAVDWTPPPKPPVNVVQDNAAHDRLVLTAMKKPILKHRSISELLTSDLPSPLFTPADSDDEDYGQDLDFHHRTINKGGLGVIQEGDEGGKSERRRKRVEGERPVLLHTKSDTHITRWAGNRSFRKGSPPRVVANQPDVSAVGPFPVSSESSSGSTSNSYASNTSATSRSGTGTGSEFDGTSTANGSGSTVGKKKHISFNTFVEQCIAIEKPKTRRSKDRSGSDDSREGGSRTSQASGSAMANGYHDTLVQDDGYDEDEEDGFDDDVENGTHGGSDSDSDEGVLEMHFSYNKPPWSNSFTSNSQSSEPRHHSGTHISNLRPPLVRTPSSERDQHVTIAPIAPTILKTIGVGNGWSGDGLGDDYFDGSDDGVWLGDGAVNLAATKGDGTRDNTGGTPVELVFVPPLGSNYSVQMDEGGDGGDGEDVYHHREAYLSLRAGPQNPQVPAVGIIPSSPSLTKTFFNQPLASSPQTGLDDGRPFNDKFAEEDAYDYFGGPDMGEDFGRKRPRSGRRRSATSGTDRGGVGIVRYAQGGAASVVRGRSSGDNGPEVIISDDGDERRGRDGSSTSRSRSDERSRSSSRSRTPSPLFFAPPSHPSTSTVSVPIPHVGRSHDRPNSPPASSLLSPPTRGRNPIPSEPQARGRSATRGSSSFSDRERSGTRGTSSPIGSLSPDGSSISLGVGIGSVYAQGRVERKRERVMPGRGPSERLSPDHAVGGQTHSGTATEQYVPNGVAGLRLHSASSATSSATMKPPVRRATLGQSHVTEATTSLPGPNSNGLRGEMEAARQRARHPTPMNSPTTTMIPHPVLPTEANSVSAKGMMSRDINGGNDGAAALAQSLNPEGGTLVGKAVDMAGALLDAIQVWHA